LVRLSKIEGIMHRSNNQFNAILCLLANGVYIEQVSEAPLSNRIYQVGDSAPNAGGLVQQRLTSKAIMQSCRVGGRMSDATA
jgi:hypothetical protein